MYFSCDLLAWNSIIKIPLDKHNTYHLGTLLCVCHLLNIVSWNTVLGAFIQHIISSTTCSYYVGDPTERQRWLGIPFCFSPPMFGFSQYRHQLQEGRSLSNGLNLSHCNWNHLKDLKGNCLDKSQSTPILVSKTSNCYFISHHSGVFWYPAIDS